MSGSQDYFQQQQGLEERVERLEMLLQLYSSQRSSLGIDGLMTPTQYSQLAQLWTVPRTRVFNSANISVAGAEQTLTFDSEDFDVGGCHSTASNTGRLTVVRDGLVSGIGQVQWAASSVTQRVARVYKTPLATGVAVCVAEEVVQAGSTGACSQAVAFACAALVGDYFELRVAHSVGVAINVVAVANLSPYFSFDWQP